MLDVVLCIMKIYPHTVKYSETANQDTTALRDYLG